MAATKEVKKTPGQRATRRAWPDVAATLATVKTHIDLALVPEEPESGVISQGLMAQAVGAITRYSTLPELPAGQAWSLVLDIEQLIFGARDVRDAGTVSQAHLQDALTTLETLTGMSSRLTFMAVESAPAPTTDASDQFGDASNHFGFWFGEAAQLARLYATTIDQSAGEEGFTIAHLANSAAAILEDAEAKSDEGLQTIEGYRTAAAHADRLLFHTDAPLVNLALDDQAAANRAWGLLKATRLLLHGCNQVRGPIYQILEGMNNGWGPLNSSTPREDLSRQTEAA